MNLLLPQRPDFRASQISTVHLHKMSREQQKQAEEDQVLAGWANATCDASNPYNTELAPCWPCRGSWLKRNHGRLPGGGETRDGAWEMGRAHIALWFSTYKNCWLPPWES